MAVRNAVYAQSGGVTAVINATACGLIQEARRHPERIGKVLAGGDGIVGALTEELMDTSLEFDADIARLRSTPVGAFGSCRYKLKSLDERRAQYERLIKERLGHKYHWSLADYLQHSGRHLASRSDLDQAHALGVAAVDFAQQGKKRGDADREAARGCALSPGNRRCATEGHRQCGAQDAGRVHQYRRLPYHQCLPDLSAAADRRRGSAAVPQRAARLCSTEERHRAKKAGTVQHLIFL